MAERKRESELSASLLRTLILSVQDPALMVSLNLNYLCIGPVSKYSHIRITVSTYGFGGGEDISQSIAHGLKFCVSGTLHLTCHLQTSYSGLFLVPWTGLILFCLGPLCKQFHLPKTTNVTSCSCPFSWWFFYILQVWAFTFLSEGLPLYRYPYYS